MTRCILLATANRHKQAEIREVLGDLAVRWVLPQELDPPPPSPPEEGATFEENARSKALAYAGITGLWALADDSGLAVDALGGRPGIHSARFAGPDADDAANNCKLLAEMEQVPDPDRGAGYVAVAVLAEPGRILAESRGECRGSILRAARGAGGFGYDPLFLVGGLDLSFAQMPAEEKHARSHRGNALRALRPRIAALLH
jgi:XTP/dITP diphosphohydrolase